MIPNMGPLFDLMQNMGPFNDIMKRATETIGQLTAEGVSAGGAVTVKVNGQQHVLSVRIDPKLLADGDAELLGDLVAAATNQAFEKLRQESMQKLSGFLGGLPLPPSLFGMAGGGGGAGRS
jgi:DNA-binding YbaB/EbfC family protein